jgi:hypothetical protein
MEQIGAAAWRVLQNARKAAIARRNDEGAKRRDELFQVSNGRSAVTTRRQGAPSDTEELGGQAFAPKRSRT